jgi:hypothetical protein
MIVGLMLCGRPIPGYNKRTYCDSDPTIWLFVEMIFRFDSALRECRKSP